MEYNWGVTNAHWVIKNKHPGQAASKKTDPTKPQQVGKGSSHGKDRKKRKERELGSTPPKANTFSKRTGTLGANSQKRRGGTRKRKKKMRKQLRQDRTGGKGTLSGVGRNPSTKKWLPSDVAPRQREKGGKRQKKRLGKSRRRKINHHFDEISQKLLNRSVKKDRVFK